MMVSFGGSEIDLRIIADLHVHSKYSAATSEEMSLINLDRQAKIKGLTVLGTGDNSTCNCTAFTE
jgi:PHP family Zn ribbon phosphoesterase